MTDPAGPDKAIQYNEDGSFGGSVRLTWDYSYYHLTVDGSATVQGGMVVTGGATIEQPTLFGGTTITGGAVAEGGLTVNEDGGDYDTRIEGDNDENLLFIDAGNDRIGIGRSDPEYSLDIMKGSPWIRLENTDPPGSWFGIMLTPQGTPSDDNPEWWIRSARSLYIMCRGAGSVTSTLVIHTPSDPADPQGVTINFGGLSVAHGLIVNESGGDFDTRIEGVNDLNLVFVDVSDDRVGIGTNSPSAKLDVRGSVLVNGPASPDANVGLHVNKGIRVDAPPRCRAYSESDQTVTHNEWVIVPLTALSYQDGGTVDPINNRYTPGKAGYYRVDAAISWGDVEDGAQVAVGVFVNGTLRCFGAAHSGNGSTDISCTVSDIVYLGASDYVDLRGRYLLLGQTAGMLADEAATYLSVHRVS